MLAKAIQETDTFSTHVQYFQQAIANQHVLSIHDSLQASLNDLNQRLNAPILMNRFRPNIVLDGEQAPWAEDEWGKRSLRVQLKQGDAVDLELCKPCSRCTVSPFP